MNKIIILHFLFSSFLIFANEKLPKNIKWITNEDDPIWSSEDAKTGGTYRTFITSFPLTFRTVGPDSNTGFRSAITGNDLSLTDMHPNTGNTIPSLATHWAYDKDGVTVYYKLDKDAKWSDGKNVTADDYIFALEFMRSKHIVAPWYNKMYTEEFDRVIKYDDYTIAVVGKKKRPKRQLHYYNGLAPKPKHFYGALDENFTKKYNWEVAPNTGPYQISEIRKGKYIVLKKHNDWWGKNKKYNKNRFNVDKIRYTVIRDLNIAYEHFLKGKIDSYPLVIPEYWHGKAKGLNYDYGYIHKMWFYVDQPQPEMGIFMNQDKIFLKDKNIRLGISYALNFEKVIKTLLRGDYERLNSITTGYGIYSNNDIKARPYDLKLAEKHFKLASFTRRDKDGILLNDKNQRLSFVLNYGVKEQTDRLVILKEDAKKAGLEINLKLLDGSSAFKSMLEKQHELAYSGWSASLFPQYWEMYHSDNAHKTQTNNLSNLSDKRMDKLIEAYDNEFDETKRAKYARDIQRFVHDEAVSIPSFLVPYFRLAYWRYWKFPKIAATKFSDGLFDLFGATGGLFWFDKDEYENTMKAKKERKKLDHKTIIDKTYKI